jgi:hypothetical protein
MMLEFVVSFRMMPPGVLEVRLGGFERFLGRGRRMASMLGGSLVASTLMSIQMMTRVGFSGLACLQTMFER